MPGLKRKATKGAYGSKYKRRRASSRATYKKVKSRRRSTKFARAVKSVIFRNMETKEVFRQVAVNATVTHNQLLNIDDNAFYCEMGTRGEDMQTTTSSGTRIGKEIFVKGIKVALLLEARQKRARTTYWLYLIRNKPNPSTIITSKSEIFEGRSTTIPMDYLDTDKCHVLFCKKITISMPNAATSASMEASGFAPTWVNGGNPEQKFVVTNPQRIEKFYIPINKKFIYGDDADGATGRVKPIAGQQYQWVLVGYDNYTTPSSGTDSDIASVHMTSVMYYKDI